MAVKAAGTKSPTEKPKRVRTLTLDDLPSEDTRRWVAGRKALVVKGVEAGLISPDDACARYSLSQEEFASWRRRFAHFGVAGLRAREPRQR